MVDSNALKRGIFVTGVLSLMSIIFWLKGYLPYFSRSTGSVRIVFIGDSNTHSQRNQTPDGLGNGYVRLISERLRVTKRYEGPGYVVINRGVRGDGIQDLAKRWKNDVLEERPDILSVAIGINDATGKRLTNEEFQVTYKKLLQQVRQANPELKILLMEVFLIGNGPTWLSEEDLLRLKDDVTAKNTIIRAIGAEIGARIVSLEKLLLKNPDHDSDFYPEKDDGIHISKRGHARIADAWFGKFEE